MKNDQGRKTGHWDVDTSQIYSMGICTRHQQNDFVELTKFSVKYTILHG